jgi:hypothetical protein
MERIGEAVKSNRGFTVSTSLAVGSVVVLATLLAACAQPRVVATPENVIPTPAPEPYISVTTAQVNGDIVVARGYNDLPEGSCVLTQLYADDEPVEWWPSDRCAAPRGTGWTIGVQLGEEGRPDALDADRQYMLRAWCDTDPSIESEPFYFDLAGPPAPAQ